MQGQRRPALHTWQHMAVHLARSTVPLLTAAGWWQPQTGKAAESQVAQAQQQSKSTLRWQEPRIPQLPRQTRLWLRREWAPTPVNPCAARWHPTLPNPSAHANLEKQTQVVSPGSPPPGSAAEVVAYRALKYASSCSPVMRPSTPETARRNTGRASGPAGWPGPSGSAGCAAGCGRACSCACRPLLCSWVGYSCSWLSSWASSSRCRCRGGACSCITCCWATDACCSACTAPACCLACMAGACKAAAFCCTGCGTCCTPAAH